MAKVSIIASPTCLKCDNYMDCRDRIRFATFVEKINSIEPSNKMKIRPAVTITCSGYKDR